MTPILQIDQLSLGFGGAASDAQSADGELSSLPRTK